MALKEAKEMQAARAKIGAFGNTGSGKTTTLSLLAAGMSKRFHGGAPVAFFSTEPGVDFVKPIFAAEGIQLFEERSKAFSDLIGTVKQAQTLGCEILIVDSVTHVWRELVDAYCKKRGVSKPEFHHWKDIKGEWSRWTDLYVNAPIHMLVAGRAGNEYEYEEDERGKKELVKGDSKMKAETEFGYEADLLIELFSDADLAATKARRKKGEASKIRDSRMRHTALVKKSRAWALNGRQFFYDDRDTYAAGECMKVVDDFMPYFEMLNLGGVHVGVNTDRNSEGAFDREHGSEWLQNKRRKEVALEEITASLVMLFGAGRTDADKKNKLHVLEAVFGVRSWTAVENMGWWKLTDGRDQLKELETVFKQEGQPDSEDALNEWIKRAKENHLANAVPDDLVNQLTGELVP